MSGDKDRVHIAIRLGFSPEILPKTFPMMYPNETCPTEYICNPQMVQRICARPRAQSASLDIDNIKKLLTHNAFMESV